MDEDRRRLFAKRFNEHIKLLVTTFNAIALVVFGAGVLQPLVTGASVVAFSVFNLVWVAISITLHLFAQALIRLVRLE
jgi:hypothetical protein